MSSVSPQKSGNMYYDVLYLISSHELSEVPPEWVIVFLPLFFVFLFFVFVFGGLWMLLPQLFFFCRVYVHQYALRSPAGMGISLSNNVYEVFNNLITSGKHNTKHGFM